MREVADRFTAGVVEGARKLRVGDPLDWDTEIGPMVSTGAVRARARARRRRRRERRASSSAAARSTTASWTSRPTVLTNVTHDMRIMREEIFGPVVPIVTVDSEEEAIGCANDSEFGLGASVWTSDRAKGERIARRIESGMVWINDHMYTHGAMQCAWGGVKDSGPRALALEVRLLRVRERQADRLGAVAHAQLLVAPVRRVARQGHPRRCAAALRARRGQARRAQARRAAARAHRARRCCAAPAGASR